MKFPSKLTAALFGLVLLNAASAEDAVKFNVPGVAVSPTAAAKPAAPKFTEAQIAEAYGWYMGGQMGLRQMEFTQAQVEAMARGLIGAAAGGQPSFDAKAIGPEVEAFLGKKNEAFMTKLRYQNMAASTAFFEQLKENKNVVSLSSGLRYEIVKAGTGAMPQPGQLLTIHYTGALVSGQIFDNTRERGQPAELVLQDGVVIPGMFEGMQKIGIGGTIKLYIPPSLAYGDQGSQVIPPGATLIFEIEVLSAKEGPKVPAPAAK